MVSKHESGLAQEIVAAGEAEMIRSIVEANLKTHSVWNGVAQRGQHAKHHACVVAEFRVLDDLANEHRVGLFKEPQTYSALIRFSNGAATDDRKADAHGMAIKVLDVSGEKALEQNSTEEHDFILVDQPVFFAKNLEEYLGFNEHATKIIDFRKNKWDLSGLPRRLIGLASGVAMLSISFRETLGRVKVFTSGKPNSPLTTTYWSTTPYLFGEGRAVKYMASSTRKDFEDRDAGPQTADQLALALKKDLQKGRVVFRFGVHVQTDPIAHPIEDTTVDWGPGEDNFVPLAEIVIGDQPSDHAHDLARLADHLDFSPWHALAEHRPMGSINRSRKAVYQKMSKLRRDANLITASEVNAIIQRVFQRPAEKIVELESSMTRAKSAY